MTSSGPANRATCRVMRGNGCGSATICGRDENGSWAIGNAHVSGTNIGGKSVFEVESLGRKRFEGRTVRAAYSSRAQADWNLSYIEGLTEVEPVYIDRRMPFDGESFYTKGFPRCRPMESGNVEIQRILSSGVALWLPDAIGGQSGSGVMSDDTHTIIAVLTWSMRYERWFGAGQLGNMIWTQNRDFDLGRQFNPVDRDPGAEYIERPGDINDEEKDYLKQVGCDQPAEVKDGIYGTVKRRFGSIQEFPIWAHMFDTPEPDPDPDDPDKDVRRRLRIAIEDMEKAKDILEEGIQKAQSESSTITEPTPGGGGFTFGL